MPAVIAYAEAFQLQQSNDMIFEVDIIDEYNLVRQYQEFGSAHNIFVNEDSGYLYSVGIFDGGNGTFDDEINTGGIQIVDVRDGFNPVKVGFYNTANYTHDIQCVIYHGPDTAFVGHEICFAFTPSVNAVTILDVSNKSDIIEVSRTEGLNETQYVHQGWVTSSHEFLLMDDELDEFSGTVDEQTTYIYDVRDLSAPLLVSLFESNLTVIDHNQYIIDNGKSAESGEFRGYSFQSNYEAGLRVINIDGIAEGAIFEVAYFDSYVWAQRNFNVSVNETDWDLIEAERHDSVNFRGAWSVYPFFKPNKNESAYSDIVVLQNINTGLMVLRHDFGLNSIFEDDEASTTLAFGCTCVENYIPYCCDETEEFDNECYAGCEGYNVSVSCVQAECGDGDDEDSKETNSVGPRVCVVAMILSFLIVVFFQ